MDADYWKTRCEAAEEALQRARSALVMRTERRRALVLLGGLKEAESLSTHQVAASLQVPLNHAFTLLVGMDAVGLVDRERGRPGRDGIPSRWRLAYLVQIPETQE